MDAYITALRRRLAARQLGAKREFLQELVKEVRVRGDNVTLTYKLPLAPAEQVLTPLKLMEAPVLCKEPVFYLFVPLTLANQTGIRAGSLLETSVPLA